MKPWPVVIASLSISPAYAFENQVIESTFASPIVTSDVSIGVSRTGADLAFPMQSGNVELVAAAQNPQCWFAAEFPPIRADN